MKDTRATKVLSRLREFGRPFWLVTGFSLLGGVGFLDYVTGYEVSFSLFYLFPIALITWVTSWRYGVIAALVGAVIWLIVDLLADLPYSHPAIPYWNAVVRLISFLVMVLAIALNQRLERERSIARMDFVTGAVNTSYFHKLLQIEIDRSSRYGHPFTLAYIDVDNFKSVNDTFGHLAGDQTLRTIAENMQGNLRSTDIVARVGGDEFAVLIPEATQEAARSVVSKMETKLTEAMQKGGWAVTFSIGVITFVSMPKSVDMALDLADKLMYSVKTGGKNSISYADHYDDSDQVSET